MPNINAVSLGTLSNLGDKVFSTKYYWIPGFHNGNEYILDILTSIDGDIKPLGARETGHNSIKLNTLLGRKWNQKNELRYDPPPYDHGGEGDCLRIRYDNNKTQFKIKAANCSLKLRLICAKIHNKCADPDSWGTGRKKRDVGNAVAHSTDRLDLILNPKNEKKLRKQTKAAEKKAREVYQKLDLEKSYNSVFELMWYSQMPCFDILNITSNSYNDFGRNLQREIFE